MRPLPLPDGTFLKQREVTTRDHQYRVNPPPQVLTQQEQLEKIRGVVNVSTTVLTYLKRKAEQLNEVSK